MVNINDVEETTGYEYTKGCIGSCANDTGFPKLTTVKLKQEQEEQVRYTRDGEPVFEPAAGIH